jgi:Amt family ammonium transporter
MHPIGSLVVGGVAGAIFVYMFQKAADPKWNFDDVLGVWPLHGLCGLWGGIACGIFGLKAFGGLGGVTFLSQLVGSLMGAAFGAVAGLVIYGLVDKVLGLRLTAEEEQRGADLSVHKIGANPEEDVRMGRV